MKGLTFHNLIPAVKIQERSKCQPIESSALRQQEIMKTVSEKLMTIGDIAKIINDTYENTRNSVISLISQELLINCAARGYLVKAA